jgi:hypothetical protein
MVRAVLFVLRLVLCFINFNMKAQINTLLILVLLVSAGLSAQTVSGLTLINANTNLPIRPLTNGSAIDVFVDGSALNIRADASGVGSVQFNLSGAETTTRVESVAPYALFGDVGGDYTAWSPALGSYTLTVQAFSGSGASGTPGPLLTLNFTVINSTPVSTGGGEFLEVDGLVVMEAESQPVVGFWTQRTSVSGFTGPSYIEWKSGDMFTGTVPPGSDVITYEVLISTAGRYRVQLRSASPAFTEHNDVWVRFPDNGALREKSGVFTSLGSSWFKVYQNVSNDTWTWNTSTVDFDPHTIYTDFPSPGVYRMELSGRSTRFKIDRMVLYNSSVSTAFATSTSRAESPRNGLQVNPDIASTSQGVAVNIPVLANDSDAGGSLDTASLSVISAPSNGSTSILSGGRIRYTPSPGFSGTDGFVYQICNSLGACGQASVSVTVNPATPLCSTPVNLGVQILSPTAARIKWDPVAAADGYIAQGRRAGTTNWVSRTNTPGTELAFLIFQPGQSYEFRVRAVCNGGTEASPFTAPFPFTMPSARLDTEALAWQVAPNPARDRIQLQQVPEGAQRAEAYDAQGRLVASWDLGASSELDISGLGAGYYVLKLADAQGYHPEYRNLVIER